MPPSTAVQLNDYFNQKMEKVKSIAPSHIDGGKIIQTALFAVAQNPELAQCTVRSLVNCSLNAASLGFELNNAMNEAWLIPRRIKDESGRSVPTAVLYPGYQGLINLARRSSDVTVVSEEVIRQRDKIKINRGENKLVHEIKLVGDRSPIGYYAMYYLENGQSDFVVLDLEEIEQIRASAQTQMVWKQWPEMMAKKSAIKRLCKVMPKSSELINQQRLAHALTLDSNSEMDKQSPVAPFIDVAGFDLDEVNAKRQVRKRATKQNVKEIKEKFTPPQEPPTQMTEKQEKPADLAAKTAFRNLTIKGNVPEKSLETKPLPNKENTTAEPSSMDSMTPEELLKKVTNGESKE